VCVQLQKTILHGSLQPDISSLLYRPLCEGISVLYSSRFHPCTSGHETVQVARI